MAIPAGAQRWRASSICIIGAGSAGLAAAKSLLAEQAFSKIVIFEQRTAVGGLWIYTPAAADAAAAESTPVPQTDPDVGLSEPVRSVSTEADGAKSANGSIKDPQIEVTLASPLYDSLETNIPKQLMGYSDAPWSPEAPLFPPHAEVLRYLEEYAKDVRHLIRFGTQVVDVRRVNGGQWRVQTKDLTAAPSSGVALEEHAFDAVLVASGHFDSPFIPQVPGIEAWNKAYPGTITHSKYYRSATAYAGKKVVVVGNSASGTDIGGQITQTCRWPLLLSRQSESFLLSDTNPSRFEKPAIAEYIVQNRSIRFSDDSVETDVDAVLYCTGYLYSLPFLKALDPPVITTGERVLNCYQHVFYHPHPTLAFLVLNQRIIPFQLAEAQGTLVARVWAGRLPLPSQEAMQDWERGLVGEVGNGKAFHILQFPQDADYINMISEWVRQADGPEVRDESDSSEAGSTTATVGKSPPFWDERAYWLRGQFPSIKKVYQDLGAERSSRRTLDDVGFNFETWKLEQEQLRVAEEASAGLAV